MIGLELSSGPFSSIMLMFFSVLYCIYLKDAFVVAKRKYTGKVRAIVTGMLVMTFINKASFPIAGWVFL